MVGSAGGGERDSGVGMGTGGLEVAINFRQCLSIQTTFL